MGGEAIVTPGLHPAPSWRRTDLAWLGVLAVALLLPVGATAGWLGGAYTATAPDLHAGVWILKVSLGALSLAALALGRFHLPFEGRAEATPARIGPVSIILLGAAATLALALRLYQVDTELWVDEILMRVRYMPLEFRQLVSTYDSQNHQPLYSIAARLSFLAAGGTDWSVRIPAVLFGVGSLFALWSFARCVTSTSESLLAVLLLAVSYHHVWFSQNARGYTAMLFFAVLGTRLFLPLCRGEGRPERLAWGYAILMALATYTHLTAALIAIGHALAMAVTTPWTSRQARSAARWPVIALALSALLTITLYAPMLPQVVREVTRPTMEGISVEWTGAGWMLREAARVLSEGIPGGLVTVFACLGVLAVGVVSYWRQSRITALLMFLPIAVTFVAIVAARHNLWPRFFFFASGFLVLAALRGGFVLVRWLVRWQPERVAVTGACAVALASLLTVPRAWQPKQQFLAALEFIEQARRPGDAVVALDVASEIYRLRGWAPGWRTASDLATVGEVERNARRTWIVFTLPARIRAVTPDLYEHVTGPRYQVVRVFPATVGGGEIHILRHDSTSTDD